MPADPRDRAARFFDLNPEIPDDLPFYRRLVDARPTTLLELGCGTGRVLVALAGQCSYAHGVELSAAMLAICRGKLAAAAIPAPRVGLTLGDITDFELGRRFDLVVAPYRVFQNLAADAEVAGFFRCAHRHLEPGGALVVSAFRPAADPATTRANWASPDERPGWEVNVGTRRVRHLHRRVRPEPEPLVLHPELIYRVYEGDSLVEEVVLPISMRCYWPDQLGAVVEAHGFSVTARWGGYAGEPYGEGPELVLAARRRG